MEKMMKEFNRESFSIWTMLRFLTRRRIQRKMRIEKTIPAEVRSRAVSGVRMKMEITMRRIRMDSEHNMPIELMKSAI